MASGGLDVMRVRPTVSAGSTEAKLQQRKLDALQRGIHRIADPHALLYGIHLIGVGGAGARIVRQVLDEAPDDLLAVEGSRLHALTIDVGDREFGGIAELAAKFPAGRARIETLALERPDPQGLLATLEQYREFLRLESPLYRWNGAFQPWIDAASVPTDAAASIPRAVAKAIYGKAYYAGKRPAAAALKRIAQSIEATEGDALVCVVFGLGGGTGSGIAVDLVRHLSNSILGRRVLVAGIGILPSSNDGAAALRRMFPVLNELDCMADETKNRGVVMSCGDLYRNPFTAGFIAVPQEHVWRQTGDRAATHARIGREVAALLTRRHGANLWELLRLLNWVAAPSSQHSAARTPWGPKWLHLLGFADSIGGPLTVSETLPAELGLLPAYRPEFIEMRVPQDAEMQRDGIAAIDTPAGRIAGSLDKVFGPEVPPQVQFGAADGSVQFVLPRVAKTELTLFDTARGLYDSASPRTRHLDHALLLDQGVQLCEPSTVLQGMAGASLWGGKSWIGVRLDDVRGEPTADTMPREQTPDAA